MKDKVTEFERQQDEFSRGEQELRKAGYLFGDERSRITPRAKSPVKRDALQMGLREESPNEAVAGEEDF